MFIGQVTIKLFEELKDGVSANIDILGKKYAGIKFTLKEFYSIVESFYPLLSPSNDKAALAMVYQECDINNDGKMTLKELITYLNKAYGLFHINGGRGKQIVI